MSLSVLVVLACLGGSARAEADSAPAGISAAPGGGSVTSPSGDRRVMFHGIKADKVLFLGNDPANQARAERKFSHDGVAAHPGDKGMRALADAILNALRRR